MAFSGILKTNRSLRKRLGKETTMKKKQEKEEARKDRREERRVPVYEEQRVITYPGDRLLKEVGPAQACRAFGCPVGP